MKKQYRRLLSLLVAVCMLAAMLPLSVLAEELELESSFDAIEAMAEPEEEAVPEALESTYVNPLFEDLPLESVQAADAFNSLEAFDTQETYFDIADAGAIMRQGMKLRQTNIVITYQTDNKYYTTQAGFDELTGSISDEALKHTGVPDEGDYLAFQFSSWTCKGRASLSGGVYNLTITYSVTYFTDLGQEQEVNARMADLMQEMALDGMTHLQKIKTIYDYITSHVKYDYTNLNNNDYLLKYSAYDALFKGTAVCQGYSVLLYRMALTAGMDCRIIAGKGNGGNHAWNIIRMEDNLYYDLDSTWDAGRKPYDYFLKCEADFRDHQRNTKYTTSTFQAQYPMAVSSYPICTTHVPVNDAEVLPTCTTAGQTGGSHCSVCGAVVTEATVIPAKGHVIKDGWCTVCGARDPSTYSPIYRLYNPYTQEHLLSSNLEEANALVKSGWTLDGVAWNAPLNGTLVYRVYNPYDDWHTYSTNLEEIDTLTAAGWTVDGIVSFSADASGLPIFRLFNPYVQTNYHMLTASVEERDFLVTNGWIFEGVAWTAMR